MTTLYKFLSQPDEKGYAAVRRLSDEKTARARISWLKPGPETGQYIPASRTKAIRLECLEWKKENAQ
jgi:hypothetical protein